MEELIDGMTWLQHNAELGECGVRLIAAICEDGVSLEDHLRD